MYIKEMYEKHLWIVMKPVVTILNTFATIISKLKKGVLYTNYQKKNNVDHNEGRLKIHRLEDFPLFLPTSSR